MAQMSILLDYSMRRAQFVCDFSNTSNVAFLQIQKAQKLYYAKGNLLPILQKIADEKFPHACKLQNVIDCLIARLPINF
jgi:hypothetical protein